MEASEAYFKAGCETDYSRQKTAAGMALKKVNPQRAAQLIIEGVQPQIAAGRFSAAAKSLQEAGDMFEAEDDKDRAMECYKQAAEYYEMDNMGSRANTLWLKVATINATAGKYDEAIEMFEKVSEAALENHLLKYSVREYLFKAMLCHFAKDDVVGARRALEKYSDMDVSFSAQREYKLCEKILEAYEAFDVDAFTTAVAEFDSLTPLDPFKTTLLLKTKTAIQSAGGETSLC